MIEVKSISKCYASRSILEDISFNFENGRIYALVGKNGEGKTSFFNAISSSLYRDFGSVFVDGIDDIDFSSRYKLFYIPDGKDYFSNYYVEEYLTFIKRIYNSEFEVQGLNFEYYIDVFKLQNDLGKQIGECSFGTKQKIYMLGAIVSGATNFIFDEPFNGIDPSVVYPIRNLFRSFIKQKKMLLYSTHSLDIAVNFSDDILFLADRKLTLYKKNKRDYSSVYEEFIKNALIQTK